MTDSLVLLIDDDDALASMVADYLTSRGLRVERAREGLAGLRRLALEPPIDAVVLDVMMPGPDGFEVLRRLRATSTVPVVMLTARGDDLDRIVGLELGADDYLPKPFNPRELLARLHAVLRRVGSRGLEPDERTPALRFGRLEIDVDARVVRVAGEERPLTGHQFELLLALARSPGRALSRDDLMQRVRGENLDAFDRSIDVHISRIRAGIEDDPKQPRRIVTLRGVGYLFAKQQD